MTYNQDTRTYEFHSQIDIKHNEDLDKRKPKLENEQVKFYKHNNSCNNNNNVSGKPTL